MTDGDLFQPALPRADEPGRLSTASTLQPGWPCRHCKHELHRILTFITHEWHGVVGCCNCDQPGGAMV